MTVRTCRYCGRIGEKQFTQMHDGLWRCKSPDYCQSRARARARDEEQR